MANKQQNKRDPIKTEPLREPGQSLRERMDDFFYDRIMAWAIAAVFLVFMAGLEWYRWYFGVQTSPVMFSLVALVGVIFSCWRIWSARHELANLRLGLRGERAMGQFLERELRPLGYEVFHDLTNDDYNIDHVLIGPAGVFSIETKTISKPERGQTKITFDGKSLFVNGHTPDRDPIIQALAAAGSVRHIIKEYSGADLSVRPVVVFPGWFVEETGNGGDLWVLNETRLIGYIRNANERFSTERVKFISAAIGRFVRDRQKSR